MIGAVGFEEAFTLVNPAHLIVFTRYPEPGKTKTRLIPALGADGAAIVQRRMTEHTITQVTAIDPLPRLEIRYSGGSQPLMEQWLGANLTYKSQGDGDLGDRLKRAFDAAFEQGARRVIAIGIDCPDLDTARLQSAFQLLHQHDVVLGPAVDGGYYLIGLRQFVADLFGGISWGTERVLQQTVAVAEQLQRSIAYLDPLADVDRPEDLSLWERVAQSLPPSQVSVIIPTLNEVAVIQDTIASVQAAGTSEIIVVDGGSQDETKAIAQSLGVKVIACRAGRARQMNAGASAAKGSILLFLHADTRLPHGFERLVQETLRQPDVVAGAFELAIQGDRPELRWVEWGVKWRSGYLQLPYGDQALFLRATTFAKLGGFPDLAIMEDFELVRRLKTQGRIAIAPASVLTSGRRWQRLGIVRTTLINQLVIAAYCLGIPSAQIAQWYRGSDKAPTKLS
ncbi:MAG: DUF2064 domain-containing protein [Leptolyngbyaceae cyanobacterium SL_7_1]|nr:DUF2064 domain-containing protein [Leptolyngbyaceae cyanobacterium SL_7_1]